MPPSLVVIHTSVSTAHPPEFTSLLQLHFRHHLPLEHITDNNAAHTSKTPSLTKKPSHNRKHSHLQLSVTMSFQDKAQGHIAQIDKEVRIRKLSILCAWTRKMMGSVHSVSESNRTDADNATSSPSIHF